MEKSSLYLAISGLLFMSTFCWADDIAKCDAPADADSVFSARITELLPADAAAFIQNVIQCERDSNAGTFDSRRQVLDVHNNCGDLDTKEKKLKAKYKKNVVVMERLGRIKKQAVSGTNDFIWDDPQKKSVALTQYFNAQACYVATSLAFMLERRDYGRLPMWQDDIEKMLPQVGRLDSDIRVRFERIRQLYEDALIEHALKPGYIADIQIDERAYAGSYIHTVDLGNNNGYDETMVLSFKNHSPNVTYMSKSWNTSPVDDPVMSPMLDVNIANGMFHARQTTVGTGDGVIFGHFVKGEPNDRADLGLLDDSGGFWKKLPETVH